MSRSPKFQVPVGMEDKGLAGVRPCGCVTAALALTGPQGTGDWSSATEKDVRDFYADMAKSGREVRWMDYDAIRSSLTFNCPHRTAAA